MNKIWLVMQREFLSRVQKKSFLIATILLPLIFPVLMGILAYVAVQQKKNATKEVILFIDESSYFKADTTKYIFKPFNGTLEEGKKAFNHDDGFGLLYIPKFDIVVECLLAFFQCSVERLENIFSGISFEIAALVYE